MSVNSNTKYQIRLPFILCLGLAAGVLIGANLNSKKASDDVGKDVQKLQAVVRLLVQEQPLAERHHDHPLVGA